MLDLDWAQNLDWASPNWTVIATLAAAISGVAGRGLVGWWAKRIRQVELGAAAVESAADRQQRVNTEQYERERAEAIRVSNRMVELEKRLDALTEQARGMNVWAHHFRHYGSGVLQQYQMACYVLQQLSDNTINPGRAAGLAAKLISSMPAQPPPVPLLQDATQPPPPLFTPPQE